MANLRPEVLFHRAVISPQTGLLKDVLDTINPLLELKARTMHPDRLHVTMVDSGMLPDGFEPDTEAVRQHAREHLPGSLRPLHVPLGAYALFGASNDKVVIRTDDDRLSEESHQFTQYLQGQGVMLRPRPFVPSPHITIAKGFKRGKPTQHFLEEIVDHLNEALPLADETVALAPVGLEMGAPPLDALATHH